MHTFGHAGPLAHRVGSRTYGFPKNRATPARPVGHFTYVCTPFPMELDPSGRNDRKKLGGAARNPAHLSGQARPAQPLAASAESAGASGLAR
jgi:hypothetical protein